WLTPDGTYFVSVTAQAVRPQQPIRCEVPGGSRRTAAIGHASCVKASAIGLTLERLTVYG
ncbi:MAG: hypothetical protein NXI32_19700, partial [bacterium]|nr:hypothetical protein [bacterium]